MSMQAKMIGRNWKKEFDGGSPFAYIASLLIGAGLGSLIFFVPPLYLVLGLGGLVFSYLLIFQIELAIVVALLVLEWLRDYNYLGGGTPFHPNGLMGLSLIFGALWYCGFNKVDFTRLPAIKYFLGFLLASFISLLFSGEYWMDGLTITLRLMSGLAIYFVLAYRTDSIKKVVRVIAVILIALVWPTVSDLIMIAKGEGNKFMLMDTARLGGGTSGPGIYLAMLLIFCVVFLLDARTSGKCILWGSLCILFGVGLFFSYGRAGWIGFAAGLFFIGLLKYKRLLFILPGLLIVVLLLLPEIATRFSDISVSQLGNRNSSTLAVRIELWQSGWQVFKANNPFFGVGYGVERYRMGEYLEQYAYMPHNDYVGILVGTGLVGFIFFMLWHVQWFLDLLKVYRQSKCEFDQTLSLAVTAVFFVSLVVRLSDNIVQSTGRMYPLAALVAVTLALPRIRAAEAPNNSNPEDQKEQTKLPLSPSEIA